MKMKICYELINYTGVERLNHLYNLTINNTLNNTDLVIECEERINEFNELRKYCNKLFCKISNTYNNKSMNIKNDWEIKYIKYLI